MLWPLLMAYYEPTYTLPALLLTLIFTLKGYKTAQEAWTSPKSR